LTGQQILWITIAVMIVLLMEGLNSVIEKMMDLMHPNYSPIVKFIKDVSAAMVLIAAVFSIVIGTIIFGESIFDLSPKYGIIIAIVFLMIIKIFSKKGEGK
jgi:diacylglycerol kinase